MIVHVQQASSMNILSAGHLAIPSPELFHLGTIGNRFSALGARATSNGTCSADGIIYHCCLTPILGTPTSAICNRVMKMPAVPVEMHCWLLL